MTAYTGKKASASGVPSMLHNLPKGCAAENPARLLARRGAALLMVAFLAGAVLASRSAAAQDDESAPNLIAHGAQVTTLWPEQVVDLLRRLTKKGFDVIKTGNLYTFDGERAYSLAQGE